MSLLLLDGDYRATLDLKFFAGLWDSRISFARADGSTCATYRDAAGVRQTIAANLPRFDHDLSGNPLGLLIETATTNFLLNSTAPVTQTTASLNTGTYTLSCEGSGSVTIAGNTATITNGGAATAGSPRTITVSVAGTVNVTVTGTVTAFQLENGSDATSLIVTGGATASRGADIGTLAGTIFGFNTLRGTFVAEAHLQGVATGTQSLFQMDDGGSNNRININRNSALSGGIRHTMNSGGGNFYRADSGVISTGATIKSAIAYTPGDSYSVLNGVQVADAVDTGFTSLALTTLALGTGSPTGTTMLQGHLRRLRYFPTALPVSQMAALTR